MAIISILKSKIIHIIPIIAILLAPASGFAEKTDLQHNYVRVSMMLDEYASDSLVNLTFFDGLGRPSQEVAVGITPSGNDLARKTIYNALGLPHRQYLDGISMGGGYASSIDYSSIYQSDSAPFSTLEYENAPAHRMISKASPGEIWHRSPGSVEYCLNTYSASELQCRYFTVDFTPVTGWPFSLSAKGYYRDGEIDVTRLTDEEGRVSLEFTDPYGHKILVRRIIDGAYADTYYVYDRSGNLTVVLPPECTQALSSANGTWSSDCEELSLWGYLYVYDMRNRMVRKKLPGCDHVLYRYDDSDEPLMWQDGNMRAAQNWRIQLRDSLRRPTLSGICRGVTPPETGKIATSVHPAVTSVNETILGHAIIGTSINSLTMASATFYDDYKALAGFDVEYFKLTGRHLTDDMHYMNLLPSPRPDGTFVDMTQKALGRATINIQTVLTLANREMFTVYYYDKRGRLTDTYATNHLRGVDHICNKLDFTSRITSTVHTHTSEFLSEPLVEQTDYSYDRTGRLLSADHTLTMGAKTATTRLVTNTYDELGRLATTSGSPDATATDYSYNIQSWPISQQSAAYSQNLVYSLSGNVSKMTWQAASDTRARSYDFSYDQLGRLIEAKYGAGTPEAGHYDTSYTYDLQGNPLTVTRNGLHDGSQYKQIDNITYTYKGNQVVDISDKATSPTYKEIQEGVNSAPVLPIDQSEKFKYDSNGNMTEDFSRKMRTNYDANNLPSTIFAGLLDWIIYGYDSDGKKLREQHCRSVPFNIPKVNQPLVQRFRSQKDYCANIIYSDSLPMMLRFDGGYVDLRGEKPRYNFYMSDHLGNVRAVIDEDGGTLQTNHYYPFGILMGESTEGSVQPYKFGGKELERQGGLDLYDFEARRYDGMRFINPDPMMESYYDISPYTFCLNNPLRNSDPTGMWTVENQGQFLSSKVVAVFPEIPIRIESLITDKDEKVIFRHYKAAQKSGVPIVFVKDVKDFVDAMKELAPKYNFSVVTINSHGNEGTFKIGTERIDINTDFSGLNNVLEDKTLFIQACLTGLGEKGEELTRTVAEKTESTVISSLHTLVAGYRYNLSNQLNERDLVEQYPNGYKISHKGDPTKIIHNIKIGLYIGIFWDEKKTF